VSPAEQTCAWASTVVDALVRRGVRHVALSPGSRSAPLALAVSARPELAVWPIPDERSAAFFALGVGMASGTPAAVVVTSGTAGANAYPAVIEASMAKVPMVVVTANRPPELHGFGALQTIDQHRLFGAYAEFVALPVPEPQLVPHLEAMLALALGRGVVHLDVPLREPLVLPAGASMPRPLGAGPTAVRGAHGSSALDAALELLRRRCLIVAGPARLSPEDRAGVAALAERLHAPILAEAASGFRFGPQSSHAVAHYEALLRVDALRERLTPQLVIRVGGPLTTRTLQAFVDGGGAPVLALAEPGRLCDPNHSARAVLEGPTGVIARGLATQATEGDGAFLQAWLEADRQAAAVLERHLIAGEPAFARALVAALPPGCNLMLSNSMPIRDVDAFASRSTRRLEMFSSRGACGIDGINSTAFGVAAATAGKTVLLAGDTAFLHDVGGFLWGARLGIPLAVVVVNNAGGRIFELLPVAQSTDQLEELFVMPPNVPLQHVARAARAAHHVVLRPEELGRALTIASPLLGERVAVRGRSAGGDAPPVRLIEVSVEGRDGRADRTEAWAVVKEALA
jgi:2-succinyl-5-enolpyruvyl-6-hydroxy-3-cyclohexene-1-carboxylate synthase